MKSDNELILKALDSVSEWQEYAICQQVTDELHVLCGYDYWNRRVKLEREVASAMQQWELYSGSPSYPVPASFGKTSSPHAAYRAFNNRHAVWEGEYGFLRAELLNFLKEYFKNAN